MKYIRIFEDFNDEFDDQIIGTVKDILTEINDDGFETKVTDTNNEIIVNICKPGIEYKRNTNLGFKVSDILSTLNVLCSHLDEFKMDVAYFHIKGYETSTWYSADTINDLVKIGEVYGEDTIDQLELQFDVI